MPVPVLPPCGGITEQHQPGAARSVHRGLAGTLAAVWLLMMPQPAPAQQPLAAPAPQAVATGPQQQALTQAQLEQLLAPIALYPDDLLMQVLMAATYPLEVVQAKRWLEQGQNAQLRGDALAQALVGQSWDPSVKSLLPFPDVLAMMNQQLDWTQQLGDAVLGQQQDVMNAVQVLRGRAQAAGMLQSGPQQTVNVTQVTTPPAPAAGVPPPTVVAPPQVITIAPTQPEVVYVPAYDPNVVYGAWPYPQTPPYYYPPPVGWGVSNALLTGMAFATGAAIVGSLWGWASPGWGRGNIDVNVNRYNTINVNRAQINNTVWRHDVSHRHGVAYSNDQVRNRVGGNRPGIDGVDRSQARDQLRGRLDQADRGGGLGGRDGPSSGRNPGGERPGGGNRPHPGGADGSLAGRNPGGGSGAVAHRNPGARPAASRPQRPVSQRSTPQGFQGLDHGGRDRAAAQRGAASRQAMHRPSGGRGGGRGGSHRR